LAGVKEKIKMHTSQPATHSDGTIFPRSVDIIV
jgi:hypothetical protein